MLGPGESRQVLFKHRFTSAGSHVIEVAADEDPLKADNVARASIPVLDRISVLLVSGDPNPLPLKGETAYLEIALQPFAHAGAAPSPLPAIFRLFACITPLGSDKVKG